MVTGGQLSRNEAVVIYYHWRYANIWVTSPLETDYWEAEGEEQVIEHEIVTGPTTPTVD